MKRPIAILLIALTLIWCVPAVFAHEADTQAVSDSSQSDIYGTGKFVPAEYLPSFASVPVFYRKVENLNNLYMFMDVYGNAHKRRYGSIDGVYGWYEASGPLNEVADHSFPVNVENDRQLTLLADDMRISDSDSFIGILPPENPVEQVSTVFGVEITQFLTWALSIVAFCCIVIVVVSLCVKNRHRRY